MNLPKHFANWIYANIQICFFLSCLCQCFFNSQYFLAYQIMFLFSKWSRAVGVGVFNSAKDLWAALNSPYQKVQDEALVEGQWGDTPESSGIFIFERASFIALFFWVILLTIATKLFWIPQIKQIDISDNFEIFSDTQKTFFSWCLMLDRYFDCCF